MGFEFMSSYPFWRNDNSFTKGSTPYQFSLLFLEEFIFIPLPNNIPCQRISYMNNSIILSDLYYI